MKEKIKFWLTWNSGGRNNFFVFISKKHYFCSEIEIR